MLLGQLSVDVEVDSAPLMVLFSMSDVVAGAVTIVAETVSDSVDSVEAVLIVGSVVRDPSLVVKASVVDCVSESDALVV